MRQNPHRRDYEKLNEILDEVQTNFALLLVQQRLRRASIERWRWDQPAITLSWIGGDDVNRNMNALIVEHGPLPTGLSIEVNAWKDKVLDTGRMMRLWNHRATGRLSLPVQPNQLVELVQLAYNMVAQWSLSDLTEEEPISTWPFLHKSW